MSKPLTAAKIERACASLPGWSYQRHALGRRFRFKTFRDALAFMVRAGFEAEEMNHHPEWTNTYNEVRVRLNTHDAGGEVTAKDVTLAERFQVVYDAMQRPAAEAE